MSKFAWTMIFVAVGAMLLPWQRCRDDCHDEVTPLGGGHGCHGSECPDEPRDDAHDGPEHVAITIASIVPDAPVQVDAIPVVAIDDVSVDLPVLADSASLAFGATPSQACLESAVLLL